MTSISANATTVNKVATSVAVGNRWVKLRETLLAYLFIAPALLVTFTFGLFPVILGFVISMQDGTLVPTGFIGFRNYLAALGSIAYLLALALALTLIIGAYFAFRVSFRAMQAGKGDFWPYLLPGTLTALVTLLYLGIVFGDLGQLLLLPILLFVLAGVWFIGLHLRHNRPVTYVINAWLTMLLTISGIFLTLLVFHELDVSSTPYLAALSTLVSYNKYIMPLTVQFAALGLAALTAVVVFLLQRPAHHIDAESHPTARRLIRLLRLMLAVLGVLLLVYIIAGQQLLQGTLTAFARVTPDQLAAVTSLKAPAFVDQVLVWPEVFITLLGTLLIGLAFLLWMDATRRQTSLGMLSMLGLALMLMVGGWLLIGELPQAMGGDSKFYQAILRTGTYAALTVPLQLALGLFLAYLLFYEVGFGKSFYRIVFFIPYIAPVAATSVVFAVLFSQRDVSPVNQFIHVFGLPTQRWLVEQRGVFEIVAQLIGGRQTQLPPAFVGPQLPLITAILFSVWVYSGYDAVIFLAGLGAVPRDLIESAQVDGANRWTNFRFIIFPMISPTTFFLSILAIIGTIKALDAIYVLRDPNSRGAMDTATVYIFDQIRQGNRPYAAAAGFVVFAIILILTLVQNRMSRDQVFYG